MLLLLFSLFFLLLALLFCLALAPALLVLVCCLLCLFLFLFFFSFVHAFFFHPASSSDLFLLPTASSYCVFIIFLCLVFFLVLFIFMFFILTLFYLFFAFFCSKKIHLCFCGFYLFPVSSFISVFLNLLKSDHSKEDTSLLCFHSEFFLRE
jgi:hypothetical protein